jgi:predicted PurR-regulated permease PerM
MMNGSHTVNQGARLLLIIAGIIIVALGMRAAAGIINTIALALILSISMTPLMNWLIRKGLPRGLALLMITVLVVVVVVVFAVIIVVSVQNVIDTLPTYQDQLQELQDDFISTMSGYGINVSDLQNSETFSAENIINIAISAGSAVVGAISSWFFMLLLVTYMLIEAIDFPAKIEKTLRAGSAMPERFLRLNNALRSYIFMTVWIGALTAVIMTIIMFIMGVDFALLWGILAFIMSFIPYVGFVIALVPPAVLALLEGGWVNAVILVAAFLAVNTLTDNVLKPRVMGKGLDLSPAVIMLSLFIWAWVLGPIGALLAVPMTIIVKELFLETNADTRWIANLMMPLEAMPGAGPVTSDAPVEDDAS